MIDIGTHFGIFTISALRKVGPLGKVISFDPSAATRSVLFKTLELNGFSGIPEVRDEAVCNVTGESLFFSSTVPGDAANSLIGNALHQTKSQVRTIRLDGSRALIMKHRPAVLLSVLPMQIGRSGKSLSDLWDMLDSLKLEPYMKDQSVSLDWFRGQTELFDVCLEATR